jgi:hypothetical protein
MHVRQAALPELDDPRGGDRRALRCCLRAKISAAQLLHQPVLFHFEHSVHEMRTVPPGLPGWRVRDLQASGGLQVIVMKWDGFPQRLRDCRRCACSLREPRVTL